METSVYWVYDDAHELLYVGMTQNVRERMKQHSTKRALWVNLAHSVDIEVFADRSTAEYFEAIAIEQDSPIYNLAPPSWRAFEHPSNWPVCLVACEYRIPFEAVRFGRVEVPRCAYGP